MNKKSIKLFAVSALAFFASATLVNAKTYTNLDDLTKDVETWRAKENEENGESKEDGYIYIVGQYVFTSNYVFETWEDLATAFQTIPTSSKSYIFQIDRKYNGLEATGWNVEGKKNLFNNTAALPESINIQYIDMERFGDKVATNEEVESLINIANSHVNATENTAIYDKYELSFDEATGKVTFTAKDPSLKIEEIKNSGIIAELSRILATENYTEIKITDLAEGGKSASLTANATTETIATSIKELVNGTTDLADLTNKKFKIEFVLEEGKIPADDNLSEFELDFVSMVDTDEFLTKNVGKSSAGSYAFSCSGSEDEHCVPVVNILNSNNKYSGVVKLEDALKNALNDVRISSIHFEIGNATADYTSSNDVSLTSLIESAMGKAVSDGHKYSDLANLKNATVTFTLADGVKSIYEKDSDTIEYKVYFGEYVDTDNIVDQIAKSNNESAFTSASKFNEYYNLSREENQLTLNVNLQSNGQLYSFQTVTNGLEQIIYGEQEYSVIKKSEDKISKIVIIDNKTNTEYELKTKEENEGAKSLTEILAAILGVTSANGTKVSPSMLKDLHISIKFEIAAEKELIPGVVGGDYTEDNESATYDIAFKINDFNIKDMLTNGFKNDKYLTLTETEEENVYNLNVDLKDVNTTLEEANLLGNLGWYAGLFKSMTITVGENVTELDLNDVDGARKTIDELLEITNSSTIEDLYNKEFTLKLVLADDVNLKQGKEFEENTNRTTEYTIKVKLTYKVETVDKNGSIETALEKEPEVIELTAGTTYGSNLTIGNDDNTNDNIVINGNGATINGDVEVKANNVTFNDVNITGKLSIPGTGADTVEDITITGNGNTTITGAIDIENDANVTIDGMKIVGTNKEIGVADSHTRNTTNAVINVANGKGTFTLKNSEVSYVGGKSIPEGGSNTDTYVYSLVYINGNAEIIDNEFDITNVKNPIEYKYGATDASNIVIKNNKFTGNNYVQDDAHNVISFYGAQADSVIEVSNNEFEYANWAIRISNTTSSNKVTYIITGNHVEKNQLGDEKSERNPLALVGVQEINDEDLENITIVYDNNTASGYVTYETKSEAFNEALEAGKSALVYAYKKDGKVSDKLPKLQTYEEYVEELNSAED